MDKKKLVSLEITNSFVYLEPVLYFLNSIMVEVGISFNRRENTRRIVGKVLESRMHRAFPDTEGTMYVEFFLDDTVLEVSIRDKGIPGWYDGDYDVENISEDKQSFLNFLFNQLTDGVGIERLGKEGQRIFIRIRMKDISDFEAPELLEDLDVLDWNVHIKPVRTEEEVLKAIRCLYSEYGYSYAYERLYYVDSFLSAIREKKLLPWLLVNDHEQVAGYFALSFSEMFQDMPEISSVVIRKEFRGMGLMTKIAQHSLEAAKEMGLRAIMGQPVAMHTKTQKTMLHFGFTPVSMLFAYVEASSKGQYSKDKNRLDLCCCVKILDEHASSRIYPPKELRPFLEKIYQGLGWQYEFLEGCRTDESTELQIEENQVMQITKMILKEASDDLESLLKQNLKSAIRNKIEMVELAILLNRPSAGYAYGVAKSCGFSLSGVMPGGANGDYLIMQLLPGETIDYDRLVLEGGFAQLRDDIICLEKEEKL